MFEPGFFTSFLQVIMIDLVLAGDNAVVMASPPRAAAGPRRKAIVIGLVAATLMRIGFALIAAELLAVTGLLFAGGLLLLWVCWKMSRSSGLAPRPGRGGRGAERKRHRRRRHGRRARARRARRCARR